MQKKGQVTIFIILGIVVAVILLVAVVIRTDILTSTLEVSKIEAEAELPEEKDIVAALENCINEKTEEAVLLAGMQGGYVFVPDDNIIPGPNNPFSNALIVTGSMQVPYWQYEAANGVRKDQKPNMALIQEQLSTYVRKEISECAPDVASLYNIDAHLEEIKVQAIVRDNRVTFLIDYPVTIESDVLRVRTGEVVSVVDVPLGRLLGYAQQVLESEDTFLEDRTIDMMVLYDELPFSGTEFTCVPRVWTKPEVEGNFKTIVSENVQHMRLADTINNADQRYFNWDAVDASGLRATFLYSPSWPMKIDVAPAEGQMLTGDSLNDQISNEATAYMNALFCITNYHFVYNVKYPVLLTLTDADTGYQLRVAMQVIIKNNQPRENKADITDINLETEVCSDRAAQATVAAYEIMPDNSLEPISGANIKYKCANTVCPVGRTGEDGELTALFPECYNGFVLATKKGMLDEKQIFSTNEESEISLMMDTLYTLPFEIKVIDKGSTRSIKENEQAIIQLTRQGEDYAVSVSQEQEEISLAPGTYALSTTLIQESSLGIKIDSQQLEHCYEEPLSILGVLGFTKTKCETTDIPATTLPQVLVGGSKSDWQVMRTALSGAEKITFYIPFHKTPSNYDELSEVQEKVESTEGKDPDFE